MTAAARPAAGEVREAARWAILGGLGVLLVKLAGAWLTGSVGVLSDALESIVNVAAAALTAWAVAVAARPPDDDHPYGHDKAEYLSSVTEGLLIGVAAVLILGAARERILDPRPISAPVVGLLVTAVASGLNLLLGRYLVRVGRAARSIALEADGRHVLADVITSAGVLAGVGLAAVSGWWWLDPAVAILVAVNVLRTGWQLVSRSLGGLMDRALTPEETALVTAAIERYQDLYLEAHGLRSRASGPRRFVDFHLVLPDTTTVQAAHDLCDDIEDAIVAALPDSSVTIHVEPSAFRQDPGDRRY